MSITSQGTGTSRLSAVTARVPLCWRNVRVRAGVVVDGRVRSVTVRRTGLIAAVALVALAVGCGGSSTTATSSAAPVPTTTTEPGTAASSNPSSAGPVVTPVAACDTDYLARFNPRQKLAQLLTV